MCIFFGPNRAFTNVYPFRIEDVEAAVSEVRAAARERGVRRLEWWVSPETKPPDLADRLREQGLTDDPPTTAMALVAEPPLPEAALAARPVRSIGELRRATEIAHEAFEDTADRLQAQLEDLDGQWQREGRQSTTFLAFLGSEPVGAARSVYLGSRVVLLVSGGVLERARGRGAYRALVHARWEDAVARGTPLLLVFGGPMSRPILERSGFEPLFDLEILADDFSD